MNREQLVSLMPEVYQRCVQDNTPLDAVLDVMENLFVPSEEVLQKIDSYFCAYSTPDDFVYYLAKWVDLERYIDAGCDDIIHQDDITETSIEIGRLRALIVIAAELSRWRGTIKGLTLFLQTATGIDNYRVEEVSKNNLGMDKTFHIRVIAPHAAIQHKKLIEKIINGEKPAYVTSELEFETELLGEI